MIPAAFSYQRATSVEDASRLLGRSGDDAKVLAGGHSLIPLMRLRLAQPSVLVDITTRSEDPPEPTPEELSKVMAALGRRGGKIGGKRRMVTMSQEERSAVALKAARARWKKAKGKRA